MLAGVLASGTLGCKTDKAQQASHEPLVCSGEGDGECTAKQATPGCEPSPTNKSSGQGNTADYTVCIPSAPTNNDQTCARYREDLETRAGNDALRICVDTHQVACTKTSCQDTCVNTATMFSSQGMYLLKNPSECAANEDGCRLGNTGWDCTCDCRVEL